MAINSYAVSPKYLGKLMTTTRKYLNRSGGQLRQAPDHRGGVVRQGLQAGNRFCVGTKRQTKYTSQALSLIKKKRSAWKLRGFVWFSWRDGKPYVKGQDFWGNHTGLLTDQGQEEAGLQGVREGREALLAPLAAGE